MLGILPNSVKEAITNAACPPNNNTCPTNNTKEIDPTSNENVDVGLPPPTTPPNAQPTTTTSSVTPPAGQTTNPTPAPPHATTFPSPIINQPKPTIELFEPKDCHGTLWHEGDIDVDLMLDDNDKTNDTIHPTYDFISAMGDFVIPHIDDFPISNKKRGGMDVAATVASSSSSALKRSGPKATLADGSSSATSETSSTTTTYNIKKHEMGIALVYDHSPYNSIFTINYRTNPKGYGAVKTGMSKEELDITMNTDSRGLSTACVGNVRKGYIMSECLKDLISTPHTASAIASQEAITCCCNPDKTHIFDMKKPVILVLGDQMVPPVIGGDGVCAIVIRVDKATPGSILTAAKNFFESSGTDATSLPENSIILLSLTNFCLEVEAFAYISEMEGLKRKLAKLFYSRSPANATYSSDPVLDQHITNMCYTFIDVMVPHEKVSDVAAIAAATVALVATTAAGACGKQLAGDVAATYLDAMDEDANVRRIKKWIPPIHITNDITGNSSNRAIITARQELTAYAGISNGINIEFIVKYWARVLGRCVRFTRSRRIDDTNIPSERSVLAGVFSKVNCEDMLKKIFPRIYEKFGLKKPISVYSRLGPRVKQPPTPAKAEERHPTTRPAKLEHLPPGHAAHQVRGRLVLVGASNAANLLDIFKQGFPHVPAKVISPRGMGSRFSRCTIAGIKADIAREKLQNSDTIVLFGFSNSLLRNKLTSPLNSTFSLKPLSLSTTIDSKAVHSFHACISAKFSSNTQPLYPISDSEVAELCALLVDLIRHLEKTSKANIILLGPLPRFPLRCCADSRHHGSGESDTMTLIRDINAFVVASDVLNTLRSGGNCLAIPFDVVARRMLANPYDGSLSVKADNVHVHEWVLKEIASLIIAIMAASPKKEIGLSGDHPVVTSLDFKSWRPAVGNDVGFCILHPIINTNQKLSLTNITIPPSARPCQ